MYIKRSAYARVTGNRLRGYLLYIKEVKIVRKEKRSLKAVHIMYYVLYMPL